MNDKVYPALAEDGHHGRPSAPPLALSSAPNAVAIQMPEKAIQKEQKESLLPNKSTFDSKHDQIFYGLPPAGTAAMAMAPPAAAPGRRRRRGKRGCCCCCVVSFLATLATIVVILGVAALIVYLVLKPKAPKFSVTDAAITEFRLSSTPAGPVGKDNNFKLDTYIVFSVEARNPNKKISFYYDDVAVSLLYAEQEIGQGSIPAFYHPYKNTTFLSLPIQGHQASLTSSSGPALQSSLQNDASIPLQTKAVTKARVKVGRWKSRRYKIHVICTFQLSNPNQSPNSDVSVLSTSCKLKIKNFSLRF